MEQVAALIKDAPATGGEVAFGNLKLAPRQLVLFPNGFKADAPEKNRPDYWGAYNLGNGEPIVRISAWARKDRNQHAMLGGATSYPIPGKSEVQQQVSLWIDDCDKRGLDCIPIWGRRCSEGVILRRRSTYQALADSHSSNGSRWHCVRARRELPDGPQRAT